MEGYKGFLLKPYSIQREIREWDGHRNEGTEEYETVNGIDIIDISVDQPYTVAYKSDIKEAKEFVDTYLTSKGRAKIPTLEKKLEQVLTRLNKVDEDKEKLRQRYVKLACEKNRLENELFNYRKLERGSE